MIKVGEIHEVKFAGSNSNGCSCCAWGDWLDWLIALGAVGEPIIGAPVGLPIGGLHTPCFCSSCLPPALRRFEVAVALTPTCFAHRVNSPVSLFTIDTSLYTGVFVEYVLTDGVGNSRAGKLTVVSDGASVAYDDDFNNTSPSEIGSTSFTFNATMSSSVVSINCNTITGTYTLKAIIRAI